MFQGQVAIPLAFLFWESLEPPIGDFTLRNLVIFQNGIAHHEPFLPFLVLHWLQRNLQQLRTLDTSDELHDSSCGKGATVLRSTLKFIILIVLFGRSKKHLKPTRHVSTHSVLSVACFTLEANRDFWVSYLIEVQRKDCMNGYEPGTLYRLRVRHPQRIGWNWYWLLTVFDVNIWYVNIKRLQCITWATFHLLHIQKFARMLRKFLAIFASKHGDDLEGTITFFPTLCLENRSTVRASSLRPQDLGMRLQETNPSAHMSMVPKSHEGSPFISYQL